MSSDQDLATLTPQEAIEAQYATADVSSQPDRVARLYEEMHFDGGRRCCSKIDDENFYFHLKKQKFFNFSSLLLELFLRRKSNVLVYFKKEL